MEGEGGGEEVSYINGQNELLCCLGTQGCMYVAVGDQSPWNGMHSMTRVLIWSIGASV